MSADTLLKSRSRAMLSMPRKKISRKKKMNTSERWKRIERGCLMVADHRHGGFVGGFVAGIVASETGIPGST
jgi:hypothetical protein